MNERLLNFLASSPNGYDTITKRELKDLLLTTGGQIMCRGELRDIVSKHLSAGVYRASTKRLEP